MSNYNWTSFMAHIQHDKIDEVEEKLNEYDIRQYIIGLETADSVGEHMHFMVEMAPNQYHNFSKSLFKDKYKLRGQNRNGLCKQYGKITDIRDLDKSLSYCVKDDNLRTNMSDGDIAKLKEKSYKKEDKKAHVKILYEHLDTKIHECHFKESEFHYDSLDTYNRIKIEIIKYYMKNDLKLSPQYKSMIINYVRVSPKFSMPLKLNFLKHIIA